MFMLNKISESESECDYKLGSVFFATSEFATITFLL